LSTYLADEGKLLLTEYRSRQDPIDKPWIDQTLEKWGLNIDKHTSGFYDNKEVTRVLIIIKGNR